MAKKQWKEIELGKPLGMVTNVASPGHNTAQMLLNVTSHVQPGRLALRAGYSIKYTPPSDSLIINSSFLNFEMFTDKQAVPTGQEITCLIQKGTIQAINNNGTPIVANQQNALCFWIRPYWNGVAWIDSWQWLNRILITNLTYTQSAGAQNIIKVFGDDVQGLGTNNLVGWTIYNLTKNQYAKVITSVKESTNVTRICHSLFNNAWTIGDVVFLMKNYYDLTSLSELYNVNANEIVFHKVLNDLRIGFGGQANRTGISIGYRNKYFLLNNLNFSVLAPDLTTAAIEIFSTVNGVILDEIVSNNIAFGINLTSITGSIPTGTYYFRLTAILDNYEEQLVSDNSILVDGAHDIEAIPYMTLGRNNQRVTSFSLYKSIDNITFYKINDYLFTGSSFIPSTWEVNDSSQFILNITATINTNGELYSEPNAANIANEINSIGSWLTNNGGGSITSVSGGAGTSSYSLYFVPDSGAYQMQFPISGLRKMGKFIINLYLKSSISSANAYLRIYDSTLSSYVEQIIPITDSFAQYQTIIDTSTLVGTPAYFAILPYGIPVWVDLISIKSFDLVTYDPTTPNGIEMLDQMGYTPTYNLVRAWDQALTFHGRTYFLNPFVDIRYDGFVYVSIINAANAFMYDIASADNYRSLDRFSSYEFIGMALLPTMEILILMNNCVGAIDPDTGVSRNPVYDVGCISRDSIVNINGIILWCDDEDIYMLNISEGLVPKPLLETTIRDLYLNLGDKNLIFCTRDKFNTYRVRTYDLINNVEYLLSKNGWVQEQKINNPEVYRVSINKKLDFLNVGSIYEMDTQLDFTSGGLGMDSGMSAGIGL
jgi:hypothetical protein